MATTLFDLLDAGDPLDLDVLQQDNTIIRMKSNVLTVVNDLDFTVSSPIYQGNVYAVAIGASLLVNVPRDTSGLFSFYATVVTRGTEAGTNYVKLRKSTDISRSQRRRFFRLPYVGEIKLKDPDAPELTEAEIRKREKLIEKYKNMPDIIVDEEPDEMYIELTGKDLSGGGFKALCKRAIDVGTELDGVLVLGEKEMPFKGKVVRCKKSFGTYEQYEIGFAFEEMEENDRSMIISYIFQKQRNMRRKGLI